MGVKVSVCVWMKAGILTRGDSVYAPLLVSCLHRWRLMRDHDRRGSCCRIALTARLGRSAHAWAARRFHPAHGQYRKTLSWSNGMESAFYLIDGLHR